LFKAMPPFTPEQTADSERFVAATFRRMTKPEMRRVLNVRTISGGVHLHRSGRASESESKNFPFGFDIDMSDASTADSAAMRSEERSS